MPTPTAASFSTTSPRRTSHETWPAPAPWLPITIIATTTAMSCTSRKPIAMRPCGEPISRLSDSSMTMMMVLEKVSATAT